MHDGRRHQARDGDTRAHSLEQLATRRVDAHVSSARQPCSP
ncbi:hypothetical protein [Lysobacter gummosus]